MRNKLLVVGLVAVFAMTGIASANLLTDGDFEAPGATNSWEQWAWGVGWSEITVKDATVGGNDTTLLNVGNAWETGGGGAFQIAAATAGTNYMLTVDSGAEGWWQPTGQMEMIWLDSTNGVINSVSRRTVDGDAGVPNDTLQPMQNYQLIGTAPVGAEFVKVEFSSQMPFQVGGTITFDNAVLETTAIPEPATLAFFGLAGSAILFLRRMHII